MSEPNAAWFLRPEGAFGDSLLPLLRTARFSRISRKAQASLRTQKASLRTFMNDAGYGIRRPKARRKQGQVSQKKDESNGSGNLSVKGPMEWPA